MIPKIFDIENNKVIINIDILTIPELKAVYDEYEDETRDNVFHFLRHMCDPYGPYNNLSDEEKEESIIHDFPGDYSPEDEVIIKAISKLKSFYMSPTYKYYLDNKELLYKLGEFARTATIKDTGKNGNLGELLNMIRTVGKNISEFAILEKAAEKELEKMKMKGNRYVAYDELEEEDE
jgi:hypothetical protein